MANATPPDQLGERRRARAAERARKRPAHISVVGVLGEILLTIGVLVFAFIGWQFWWNGTIASHKQSDSAVAQAQEWLQSSGGDQPAASEPPATDNDDSDNADDGAEKATTTEDATPVTYPDYGEPPVGTAPAKAEPIAVMYVPRFGENWSRVVRESVDVELVLNSLTSGIGHYSDTQMPGALGNFAVAGHDTGWGNTFIDVSRLQVGDRIYLQTPEAWYIYQFRNYEYVQPDAISVIDPVPRHPDVEPEARLMTITTCNPPYAAAERLIAYAVFERWQPASAGVPDEIADLVAGQAQGGN